MRSKIILGFAMVTVLGVLTTTAAAQQQPTSLKVANIRSNIYWTQGGIAGNAGIMVGQSGAGGNPGNTGIIVGQNGVIVVDTKNTVDSSKAVQHEIAKITPKPVTTAILTHSDGDAVNGLAGFPPGLTIIAQENCKEEMETSAGSRDPAPQDRLPTKTIAKDETMTIEGVRARLLHFAPGHTSGDLIIYFPAQKVVFAGDLLVTNQPYTFIHAEKNGSVAGWIENVRGMIALDADTYVTGHGGLMRKDDVRKKLSLILSRWDQVKNMVAQGKSLDDIKTSFGESTAPRVPNPNGNPPAMTLTDVMYSEAAKKS